MHRATRGGRAVVRAAPPVIITLLLLTPSSGRTRSARVLAFDVPPNTAYDIAFNGVNQETVASSRAGALSYPFDVDSGDRIVFSPANLAPPTPPLLTGVVDGGSGCAIATWLPSSDPTVVGYVVYAGTRSVSSGEATHYDVEVHVGAASTANVCPAAPGVNYIAVRARNYAGVLSAYSAEQPVTIPTVAVLFVSFTAEAVEEGVRLSWLVETDEAIEGLRVYRSEEGAREVSLVEGPLPPHTREWVDAETRSATSYEYVLAAILPDRSEVRSAPAAVETRASALALGQNAPNPFNPSTRIPFTLDGDARVVIRVYDVRGALVATVHDGSLPEGRHEISWDGRDAAGRPVSSGTYICALSSGSRTLSRKMTLLK